MPTVTCLKCNATFEAERSSRRFCSDACRIAYNRKKAFDEVPHDAQKPLAKSQDAAIKTKTIFGIPLPVNTMTITADPATEEQIRIGRAFMALCAQKDTDPDEFLIYLDKVFTKEVDRPKKAAKNGSGEEKQESRSGGSESFQSSLWRKKMGMKD